MGRPDAPMPLFTRRQTRRVLGEMGERTFTRLEAEGVWTPARPGRGSRRSLYDLTVVVPAYLNFLGQARPQTADRDARARRDTSLAELNEVRLAELRGDLVRREDVIRDGQAFAKALQATVRALPRRLAQAGLVTPGSDPTVTAMVRDLCADIARWRSLQDLQRAAEEAS